MLDQDAQNLAKAIRQVESRGNPSVQGASGEKGAYQFMPETWKAWSRKHLGREVPLEQADLPTQNEVAYKQIKEWKDKGFNPGQIASMWNAGEGKPDAYLDPNFSGTNAQGVKFNTAEYAKKVAETYQQFKGVAGTQPAPTTPTVAPASSAPNDLINTTYASGSNAPKSFGRKALEFAGKAGNTFFPIAGDLKNLIEGDNTKTGKQLFGDAVLSVLPLIPGLGEVGLAAKGAKAISTASKIAKVAKLGAQGYGIGVAQNLSDGKDIGESFKPGVSTLGGAALGATLPKAVGLVSRGLKDIAGITPQIENALKNMAGRKGEAKFEKFVTAAKERAGDIRKPSPQNLAADDMVSAANKLKQLTKEQGIKVGAVKEAVADKALADVTPVLRNFATDLENKFGLRVSASANGKKIFITKAKGRMKDVLSPSDQNKLKKALSQVLSLRKGGNLRKASDVLDNLDSLVDHKGSELIPLNKSSEKLERFLGTVRHNLNEVIGQSSKELSTIKSRFSELKDAERMVRNMAGKDLQRGELLMRRVFSGDFGEDSIRLFDRIRKETGIDLVDSAVLAKFATDSVGSTADKTLLQQIVGKSQRGGLFETVKDLGVSAVQKSIANPERIGRNLVRKNPGKIRGLLASPAMKKGASGNLLRVPGLLD